MKSVALLKLLAFLVALIFFARAGGLAGRMRQGRSWRDPYVLQPERYHGDFRGDMRRFLRTLFAGVFATIVVIVLSLVE